MKIGNFGAFEFYTHFRKLFSDKCGELIIIAELLPKYFEFNQYFLNCS